MPKKATFHHLHPTLRKPINVQKKQKFTVTLRERPFSTTTSSSGTVSTSNTTNIDFIKNQEETFSKYIPSLSKTSLPILQPILNNTFSTPIGENNNTPIGEDDNTIDYSNNQSDFIRALESTEDISGALGDTRDYLQNSNFNDNFSLPPAISSSDSSDDEEEHSYNDDDFNQNMNATSKKFYDVNTELPQFTGDSGPYFPNLTTMWIFIWFTKNNIGTNAYQELVKIIRHPEFKADHVPYSVTTLKKIRNGLPLLPITGKSVPINLKHTPSKTLPFKEAYAFSIKDHIFRIINNPMLMAKMYFGPGVEKEKSTEIWNGDLWKESPLFGETSITINNVTFRSNDWIMYRTILSNQEYHVGRITGVVVINETSSENWIRIQCTRKFNELPGTVKSKERYQRSKNDNEIWLEEVRIIIKPQDVIRHTSVWIKDDNTSRPLFFEFSIQEIIYSLNGRQKLRQVSLQHKLPIEYVSAPQLPPDQNMKHLKFFIDLYYDDFGAFNKAYHKLGGIYIQIGNMKRELRKKLRNHFLISFVPFGGEFNCVMEDFIADMKELQNGILMTSKNEQVWVSAGLGMATADLPQGNDLAGIRRHNAEYGCRTCKVPQNQLSNIDFDIHQNGRYHHLTNEIFNEIKAAPNITTKKHIAQEHGVCLVPNILDELFRNRHLQTPQDPFHCLAGLARRLFDHLFNRELEKSGLNALHDAWKSFEIPRSWKRLQSPITHFESYWMSDSLRLVMIMPFILSRCLITAHFKKDFVDFVKNNCSLTNLRQVKAVILETWSLFAKFCAKVFANEFCKSDYQTLDQLVVKLIKIFNKVYPDMISTLPNIHVLRHLPSIAKTFGILQNVSVSLKEMMHGVYKKRIPHTNKKNVEFDLIKRDNILQGLRNIIDNGYNQRVPESSNNSCIRSIINDNRLICLLEGWYISTLTHHITSIDDMNEQEQTSAIEPPQECFFNIRVYRKWNTKRIEKEGFVKKLSDDINMQKNLYKAYYDYFGKETAITFKTLEYYDSISFTVLQDDNVNININIHVGETIDVEDDSRTEIREYALIKGIFTHIANDNKRYAFFILDWYYDTGRIDDFTGSKIYKLQESDDISWSHIHSFHIVDRIPRVHFVHNCKTNCANGHALDNSEYLLNEFFYLVI